MNRHFILTGLLLLPLLLFGCIGPDNGNNSQGAGNISAQYGDVVTVDYTLKVDGEVIDTSMLSVAKANGIYDPDRSYSPLTFSMLLNGYVIPGFVNGILGMQVGEAKNFTVAPADGYGAIDQSKISIMPRYYNKSVFEEVPMSFFELNNITVEAGEVFSSEAGYVGIENYTNDTVTIRYIFSIGHKFAMFGIPQTVVNITNDTMLLRSDMEENKTYLLKDAATGQTIPLRVAHADEESITLDDNHHLAGKELDYEVIVRSVARPSSN